MHLRHGLLLFLAGCSSSSGPVVMPASDASSVAVDASTDAALPDEETAANADAAEASSDDATDGGAACNTIANGAPVVDIVQVAADPPQPQGGTIADGTYWQTSLEVYTGPAGPTGTTGTSQSTALVQGTTVQLVSSGDPARRTVTLSTADAGFTSADTCPDSQMSQGGYTATPSTLTIFLPGGTDDAGARTVVETLTKQ
jgi:hypothetical protein